MEERKNKLEKSFLCLIDVLLGTHSQVNSDVSGVKEHEHALFDEVDREVLRKVKEELSE